MQIIADHAITPARIYVVQNGVVLAAPPVEEDSTFRLAQDTPQGAVLYVVANAYPLSRVPLPALTSDAPGITLRPLSGISFSVTLPAGAGHNGGPLGLEMGGVTVPSQVFQFYQAIRGMLPVQIRRGETAEFAPIDDSGPIAILLWKWVRDLPKALRFTDPFGTAEALRLMYRAPVRSPVVVLTPGQ